MSPAHPRPRRLWLRLGEGFYPHDLHQRRCALLHLTGRWEEVERQTRAMLELSQQHRLPAMEADSHLELATVLSTRGQLEPTLDHAQQALELYRALGDQMGVSKALGEIGGAYADLGQFDTAVSYYNQRLELARALGDQAGIMNAVGSIGTIHHQRDEFDQAERCYQQWLEIATALSHQQSISYVLNNLGMLRQQRGDFGGAMELFQRKLAIDRRLGDKRGITYGLGNMATLLREQGRYAEALELYGQRIALSQELGDGYGLGIAWGNLGELYAAMGQRSTAREHLERSAAVLRDKGYRYHLCNTLLALAELNFNAGSDDAAGQCAEALAIAAEVGRGPVAHRARVLQARMQARSDPAGAAAALQEMLSPGLADQQRAEVLFALFQIGREEQWRERALALYAELRRRAPLAEYADRIDQLQPGRGNN